MLRLSIDFGVHKPAGLALTVAPGALLCAIAGTQATYAAPSRPAFPSYDIAKFCFTDFGQGTLDATVRGMCNRDERDARDDLRRRWSSIPADRLRNCVDGEAAAQKRWGGAGSYQGVRNCVSEAQNAAEAAQTTTAPGRRGRRRGSTPAPANQTSNPAGLGTGTDTGTGVNSGTGLGTPGLGTPGTGAAGTGAFGTTGTGTGIGNTGVGNTGLGTTSTPATGLSTTGTGTGTGGSGLGTSGPPGSSLGGTAAGGTVGGAGSSGGAGGGAGSGSR